MACQYLAPLRFFDMLFSVVLFVAILGCCASEFVGTFPVAGVLKALLTWRAGCCRVSVPLVGLCGWLLTRLLASPARGGFVQYTDGQLQLIGLLPVSVYPSSGVVGSRSHGYSRRSLVVDSPRTRMDKLHALMQLPSKLMSPSNAVWEGLFARVRVFITLHVAPLSSSCFSSCSLSS